MINTEVIANAVIMLLGILLLAWIIPESTPAYQGYGASPALIPNVAAGMILFLSSLGLLRAARASRAGKKVGEKVEAGAFLAKLAHVLKFLVPCFALFPAMEYLGFFPVGVAFMVLIQFICGQKNWLHNVLLSVLVVAGLYAAMRYGFSIAMP